MPCTQGSDQINKIQFKERVGYNAPQNANKIYDGKYFLARFKFIIELLFYYFVYRVTGAIFTLSYEDISSIKEDLVHCLRKR